MDFIVNNKLDQIEHEEILNFLSTLNYYCIEQHPDWDYGTGISRIFFLGIDDNKKVHCYANVLVSTGFFRTANINFGPAFKSFEVLYSSIQFLLDYFTSLGYIYFSVQLGTYISSETELFEYRINRYYKAKYYFKPGNLWSSLQVDLTKSEDEILRSFSKGHKSTIKSAYSKTELKTTILKDDKNLRGLIDLYIKMNVSRRLSFKNSEVVHLFESTSDLIVKYDKGFIEYIFDGDILVGGLIIVFQGTSARYFKGTSDPERREIPVMHLGLFEAMKYCKAKGFLTFDLWGYNHFVDENDQVFFINRFKKGFSDNYTFYPKRMHFELKTVRYKLYLFLRSCKKMLNDFRLKAD